MQVTKEQIKTAALVQRKWEKAKERWFGKTVWHKDPRKRVQVLGVVRAMDIHLSVWDLSSDVISRTPEQFAHALHSANPDVCMHRLFLGTNGEIRTGIIKILVDPLFHWLNVLDPDKASKAQIFRAIDLELANKDEVIAELVKVFLNNM